jgi:peptidoglycan/LPS O-acetylase OafA/YrhL
MVLLPENLLGAGRLFSLNARHGPGRADALGVGVILAGWLWFHRALWLERRQMRPRWLALALAVLALAALAGCILAMRADRDSLAFAAAGLSAAAQYALAALCYCGPGPSGGNRERSIRENIR